MSEFMKAALLLLRFGKGRARLMSEEGGDKPLWKSEFRGEPMRSGDILHVAPPPLRLE